MEQKNNIKSNIDFHISKISFNDGTELTIEPNEILIVVGPNNVGKTACLKEILYFLEDSETNPPRKIITGVESIRSGSSDELKKWFENNFVQQATGFGIQFVGLDARTSVENLSREWHDKKNIGSLTLFLCQFLSTEKRLSATLPVENVDIMSEHRKYPIQLLIDNKELETNLSITTKEAFNKEIFLNRWRGKTLSLHLGEPPSSSEPWTQLFSAELLQIPEVSKQGDGIRSFIGCILESSISTYFVTVIDEPEAFLHPSHARILGRTLSKNKPENKQLFISTHSVDLLRGFLDSDSKNIRIIRITREGDKNPIRELNPGQIKELWSDSLLRSSNVLDGLFHEKVVVCESDADCRFYSSVLDAIMDSNPGTHRPDVMFINVGGKHRIPVVVKALIALGVSVHAIADFDVLKEKNNLKDIVEAFDGNWSDIEKEWNIVTSELNQKTPPLSLSQAKGQVVTIFDEQSGSYLDEDTIKQIKEKLKMVSPWAVAKQSGKTSVPSGDATVSYVNLEKKLKMLGLFVVEVGELECFVPSIGNHGPAWVNKVLEKDLAEDFELDTARNFIKKVLDLE